MAVRSNGRTTTMEAQGLNLVAADARGDAERISTDDLTVINKFIAKRTAAQQQVAIADGALATFQEYIVEKYHLAPGDVIDTDGLIQRAPSLTAEQ